MLFLFMPSVSFNMLGKLSEAEQARQDALDLKCLQVRVVDMQSDEHTDE